VPYELEQLLVHEVAPRLVPYAGDRVVRSRTLHTTGIPESVLAERIGDIESSLAPASLAFLPDTGGVDLRLTVRGMLATRADELLEKGICSLATAIGPCAWGRDDESLGACLIDIARSRKRTIAVAESCTGGLLGARLTDSSGSGDVFVGGVIAYSNAAKREMLGVSAELLAAHGAVSPQVAEAMARGAAERFNASLAVAITGVAGPTGGTEGKPVGTVWFAFHEGGQSDSATLTFGGDRASVRERSVNAALFGLLRRIRGDSPVTGGLTV